MTVYRFDPVTGNMVEAVAGPRPVSTAIVTQTPTGSIATPGPTPAAPETQAPTVTQTPTPTPTTTTMPAIDWGTPATAQQIVDAAHKACANAGITNPTTEQLAYYAGLPVADYQKAESMVASGQGSQNIYGLDTTKPSGPPAGAFEPGGYYGGQLGPEYVVTKEQYEASMAGEAVTNTEGKVLIQGTWQPGPAYSDYYNISIWSNGVYWGQDVKSGAWTRLYDAKDPAGSLIPVAPPSSIAVQDLRVKTTIPVSPSSQSTPVTVATTISIPKTEPVPGTIEYYQKAGVNVVLPRPATSEEILTSAVQVAEAKGIVNPTAAQLAKIAGLPVETFEAVVAAVDAGQGASPQVAIAYLTGVNGGVAPTIDAVQLVTNMGTDKATDYLTLAGIKNAAEIVSVAAPIAIASDQLDQTLGAFSTWRASMAPAEVDKVVAKLGDEGAIEALTAVGYKTADAMVLNSVARTDLLTLGVLNKDGELQMGKLAGAAQELGPTTLAKYLYVAGVENSDKIVQTVTDYGEYIKADGSLDMEKMTAALYVYGKTQEPLKTAAASFEQIGYVGAKDTAVESIKSVSAGIAGNLALQALLRETIPTAGLGPGATSKMASPVGTTIPTMGHSTMTEAEYKGEALWQEQGIESAKQFGLGLVPIYRTVTQWDEMSNVERGCSVFLDVVTVALVAPQLSGIIKSFNTLAAADRQAILSSVNKVGGDVLERQLTELGDAIQSGSLKRITTSAKELQGVGEGITASGQVVAGELITQRATQVLQTAQVLSKLQGETTVGATVVPVETPMGRMLTVVTKTTETSARAEAGTIAYDPVTGAVFRTEMPYNQFLKTLERPATEQYASALKNGAVPTTARLETIAEEAPKGTVPLEVKPGMTRYTTEWISKSNIPKDDIPLIKAGQHPTIKYRPGGINEVTGQLDIETYYIRRPMTYNELKMMGERQSFLQEQPIESTRMVDIPLNAPEYQLYKYIHESEANRTRIINFNTGDAPALRQYMTSLDDAQLARFKYNSIKTTVERYGFVDAEADHGLTAVKMVYPEAKQYIANSMPYYEVRQQWVSHITDVKQASTAKVATYLKETNIVMPEATIARRFNVPEARVAEVTGLPKTELGSWQAAVKELGTANLVEPRVMPGGAWELKLADVQPGNFTPKLTYPVYATDPLLLSDVMDYRWSVIPRNRVFGEMGQRLTFEGSKYGLESNAPTIALGKAEPQPPILTKNPVRELTKVIGNSEHMQLIVGGRFRLPDGSTLNLGGMSRTEQARWLNNAIQKSVADYGYFMTLSKYGMLPTLAVYPYAIPMACEEVEDAENLEGKARQDYYNKISTITKPGSYQPMLSPLSPGTITQINKAMSNISAKATTETAITSPAVRPGTIVRPTAELKQEQQAPTIAPATDILGFPITEPTTAPTITKPQTKTLPRTAPETTPIPTEVPTPTPTTVPTPTPIRKPAPTPTRTPGAIPMPVIVPAPTTTPAPSPSPLPIPRPEPSPQPTPTPTPIPSPVPQPIPRPRPIPTPIPIPKPTPTPTPIPTPTPTPIPTPTIPPPTAKIPPTLPLPEGKYEIEKVIGVPANPGRITWEDGIVKVGANPPYRTGTKDLTYKKLKTPTKGKGTQESTLDVEDGDPPQVLILRRGLDRVTIVSGQRMTHSQETPRQPRGPGIMTGKGRMLRQRRGSII